MKCSVQCALVTKVVCRVPVQCAGMKCSVLECMAQKSSNYTSIYIVSFASTAADELGLFELCIIFKVHIIHNSYHPWFISSMVHIIHGSYHPWFISSMVHIIHGSYHPWFISSMVHIIHGSHHPWFISSMVHIIHGSYHP